MTAEPLALVLRYVRRLADAQALAVLSDGQLLERFASGNDEAAYAVLAQAYLKGMSMTKIKVLAAVVVLGGLVAGGTLAQKAPGKKQGGTEPLPESRPARDRESAPDAEDRKEPVRVRLRPGEIPIGSLGHPLGDYLSIEGIREHGFKVGNQTLRVDTINGKKLQKPIDIWVENIRDLPPDVRIELKGYETGKMDGPVPAAIKAAQDKGEEVLVPQRGWQWNAYFVALSSVNPKLVIEERKTGFKTEKPGQNPTPPRDEPK